MVLRKIFGPNRDDGTKDWGRLHNEDLHDLYVSPITMPLIKTREMRWVGHVACMGEK
jgi:hypothetical protein